MNRRPFLVYSAAILGAMAILSAWAWSQLPAGASIPIHWGIDGQANGFAPKEIGLLVLPVVLLVVVASLAVIPRVEPRRANLERSGKAYGAMWISIVTLLGAIHALIVAVALGARLDVGRLILIAVGALFVVVGNYLPTIRPNYLMGIRTPWTLASDLSWVRTHRIGGRLFVIEGLAFLLLGLLGVTPLILAIAVVSAVFVMVAVLLVYSYRIWKIDPGKRPA
jgi:uncharacterized membrane protein